VSGTGGRGSRTRRDGRQERRERGEIPVLILKEEVSTMSEGERADRCCVRFRRGKGGGGGKEGYGGREKTHAWGKISKPIWGVGGSRANSHCRGRGGRKENWGENSDSMFHVRKQGKTGDNNQCKTHGALRSK